jgi:hypothetical protein
MRKMMAPARVSSAEIWYHTNYSDLSAPSFRLGTMAEAATDKVLVLVLLGRSRLNPSELEHVSGFNLNPRVGDISNWTK